MRIKCIKFYTHHDFALEVSFYNDTYTIDVTLPLHHKNNNSFYQHFTFKVFFIYIRCDIIGIKTEKLKLKKCTSDYVPQGKRCNK